MSRPDIQVLEARIDRLQDQLNEFKEARLYGVTRKKLKDVSSRLEDCLALIHDIVEAVPASSATVASDSYSSSRAEFADDSDILDTFSFSADSENPDIVQFPYPPKEIVSNYSDKIKKFAESEGSFTGILQINQFSHLLNSWYQARFTPSRRNPDFHFKAARIHEWIDLLILAAGHSLNEGLFPAFISEMNSWIDTLNTPKDDKWVLPYSVMRMQKADESSCSLEAVLIEKLIKPNLYNESFYPNEIDSVCRIVIHTCGLSQDDVKIANIIAKCPRLIKTSSFNLSKFQEG